MIACETVGLSSSFSTASNQARTSSTVLAPTGATPGGFGNIGIYSNDASNRQLKARGNAHSKRAQQLSGSGCADTGSATMTLLGNDSLSGFFRSCSGNGDRSRVRTRKAPGSMVALGLTGPPRASESRTRAANRRRRLRSTRPGACMA